MAVCQGRLLNSTEYREYMDLRRSLAGDDIKARTHREVGDAVIHWMNSKDEDFSDTNDQSIVMKVDYKGSSTLLAGDTSYQPWKEKLVSYYSAEQLKTNILLGSGPTHQTPAKLFASS